MGISFQCHIVWNQENLCLSPCCPEAATVVVASVPFKVQPSCALDAQFLGLILLHTFLLLYPPTSLVSHICLGPFSSQIFQMP